MIKVCEYRDTYELVARFRKGDKEAYHQFCSSCFDQLFYYVLNSIKSRHLAEQILKNSLIEFWQNRDSLDVSVPLEYQLLETVESRLFEVFFSNSEHEEFSEGVVWHFIKKIRRNTGTPFVEVAQEFILRVIRNLILQNQLLNELATTRR